MDSPRSRARSSDQVNSVVNQPSTPELIRKESDEAFVVDIAETGERHIVQVVARGQDSYDFFTHKLELISGIPRAALIILAGPPFKSYNRGFPPKDCRVYLFDKRALNTKGMKVIFERMLVPPVVLPSAPAESPDQELQLLLDRLQTTNLPPLHSTLPLYERHLKLHLEKSQAVVVHSRKVVTQCDNWANARERQGGALGAAVGNLVDHLKRTSEEYNSMATALGNQQKEGKRLLEGFDKAMTKLMETPLHPAIASILGGDMLSSCIPHERYAPYVAQCRTSQERLARSADDMQTLHTHLQQSVRGLEVNQVNCNESGSARDMLKTQEDLLVVAQDLYTGVRDEVMSNIATLLQPLEDPSALLRNVLDELEKKRMAAEGDLARLVELDDQLSAQCVVMAQAMDQGANEVRTKVAEISGIQKSIVNLQQHVKLRTEALKQQREDFVHLEMIHRLPEEVSLFELEMKRRQRWQNKFGKEVKAAQGHLTELYKEEVAVREAYLHQHGHLLPPCFSTTVCPSIFQKPPRFRVDLASEPMELKLEGGEETEEETPYDMLSRKEAIARCKELENQLTLLRDKQTDKDDSEIENRKNEEKAVIAPECVSGGGSFGGDNPITSLVMKEASAFMPYASSKPMVSSTGAAEETQRDLSNLSASALDNEIESLLAMLEETLPVHVSGLAEHRLREILEKALKVVTEARGKSMISFRSFEPGDLVLFLPVFPKNQEGEGNLLYLAFNEQRPRHYLNQDSAEMFKARNNNKFPPFIVGRIIMVDAMKAGRKGDPVHNPFEVAEDTEFHVIAIEPLEPMAADS